jgi:co-chaperonin GroES (HSP10)
MSELQTKFQRLMEIAPGTLIVRGSNLLVELIEFEVRSKGGLIIANDSSYKLNTVEANKLHLGKVIYTGEGYYDADTKETMPCDMPIGAIVILPKSDIYIISAMAGLAATGNKLVMVPEHQVKMFFKTQADFDKYVEAMQ